MKSKREMSVRKFERRHPTLRLEPVMGANGSGIGVVGYIAKRQSDGESVARCVHKNNPERAIYDLSEACYRVAALDQMEKQGWADANTGQTGIGLDAHHIQKRSAGRDDSQNNLAGVSRRTHDAQHGQVDFTKK